MSNRMSVLSRRLRSFAFGFSFATFASFLVGMIANSGMVVTITTGREAAFFFVGLGSLFFFATLLFWLAYGFAWAMVPEKPAEEKRYVQVKAVVPEKPAEEKRYVQVKAVVPEVAAEEKRSVQEMAVASEKAVEEYAPQEYRPIHIEEYKPIQEYKPIEEDYKPIQYEPLKENVEGEQPAEKAVAPEKPEEEKKRAKWWKKPKEEEAVYTITGKRIN